MEDRVQCFFSASATLLPLLLARLNNTQHGWPPFVPAPVVGVVSGGFWRVKYARPRRSGAAGRFACRGWLAGPPADGSGGTTILFAGPRGKTWGDFFWVGTGARRRSSAIEACGSKPGRVDAARPCRAGSRHIHRRGGGPNRHRLSSSPFDTMPLSSLNFAKIPPGPPAVSQES
jgi:hypothetical protein